MRPTARRSVTLSVLATASPPAALIRFDHLLRRGPVGAFAVDRRAEVVDHHLGALLGRQDRRLASDAAPAAGDQHNLSVEQSHGRSSNRF